MPSTNTNRERRTYSILIYSSLRAFKLIPLEEPKLELNSQKSIDSKMEERRPALDVTSNTLVRRCFLANDYLLSLLSFFERTVSTTVVIIPLIIFFRKRNTRTHSKSVAHETDIGSRLQNFSFNILTINTKIRRG